MTGMEHAIEQAARVMARAYFGEPVEHDDMECATEWARVLADAGLLAPAPLREEWSAAFTAVSPDGTRRIERIGTPGSREHSQETCDDCNADDPEVLFFLVRSHYTDWLPVDRAEGDGRADQ